jgi:hypothetical protein
MGQAQTLQNTLSSLDYICNRYEPQNLQIASRKGALTSTSI